MKPESQPQEQPKIGRPSDYSDALADAICDRLIAGESMVRICGSASMPSETTVYRWLATAAHAGFREKYAGAREVQAHRMLDEIIEIADDASRDVVEVVTGVSEDEDGSEKERTREVERFTASARDKLRIDTRKWAMSKLAPKVYGTKQVDITSGGDKLSAIQLVDFDGSPISDV
jgi:hypothetical protein